MLDTGELAPSSSLRGVDIGTREQLEVISGHEHNEVGHHGVPYDELPLLLGLGVVKGTKI